MSCRINKFLSAGLIAVFLISSVILIGSAGIQAQPEEIRIGHVDWPGVTVKSHVVQEILMAMGYDVELFMLLLPVVFRGLDDGDLDFFLGMWWPTMRPNFTPYEEEETIEKVGLNLDETVYKTAVPSYVYEAGVTCLSHLQDYGEEFNYEVIGIEPGNEGNQIIIDAIEDSIYNLSDWQLVEGSTVAMMSAVDDAVRENDWVVFLGWEPHWMNLAYDIEYLDDPEKIWGDEDQVVYTIARTGYREESPAVYQFLEQFTVTPNIQNEWIYEYGKMERAPEDVAQEWISNNLCIVDQWVYDLRTPDGQRARDAIRAKFE